MPDKDSGSADAFNFLKAAHENGWGVSFIPFCNPTYMAGYTERLQRLGVQCWYKPYFQSLKDYLETYGSGIRCYCLVEDNRSFSVLLMMYDDMLLRQK